MFRKLALLGLCLALAAPAAAQQVSKGRLTVTPPSAKALDLRGAVKTGQLADRASATDALPVPLPTDATGVAVAAAASAQAPPVLASLAAPPAAESGQCARVCARTYYFCLAGDVNTDCAASWGQCRSACDITNPVQTFGINAPP